MLKDQKITLSLLTLIIAITLLSIIVGPLFYFLLSRQQRLSEEANLATAAAWSSSVAELQDAVTVYAKATATALTEDSTATTEAWSTTVVVAQATSVAELARTVTIQAEATSIAYRRATATAYALSVAATVRSGFTATAQAQTATAASRRASATAQAQATSTVQAQSTVLARAGSATISAAKATTVAEVQATVTTALQATATAGAEATATARSQAGMLLIFEVQEVTALKDQGDGLDELMEFFMKLRVSDNQHSTSLSYPAEGGAISVPVSLPIPLNQHAIAIDERNIVGDEIIVEVVAVDVDDQSIDEELLETSVDALIDLTFYGTIKKFRGLSRFSPTLYRSIPEITQLLDDYFDLIGEGRIILRRSEQWGADSLVTHWRGEGLSIKYRVYLTDKAPIPSTEWPR